MCKKGYELTLFCFSVFLVNYLYLMSFLKKNWIVLVLVLGVASFLIWMFQSSVAQVPSNDQVSNRPLRVVASFYPMAEFARAVGGSVVQVETITPVGTEPHEYEPTAEQIAAVYASDILLFNGAGVDTWATRVAPDVRARGVTVVEMSQEIPLLKSAEGEEESEFDPHFWLDPVLVAQKEIPKIQAVFSEKDPAHAELYKKNAQDYITQLLDLDSAYRIGLANCKQKTIVTSHAVFAYLAREYGSKDGQVAMNVISIAGISPDEEPSAGRLAEIAKLAKEKQVKYIFFESLVSPKLSETIAREIGAQTLVFNPLEGLSLEDQASGKNYLTIMTENLRNLETAMMCQ